MSKNIIAILNQKGGVGKTTTAINLAAYLAKLGERVLIIDIDSQGNTTSGLGIDKRSFKSTLYDTLFLRVPVHSSDPQNHWPALPFDSVGRQSGGG